MLTMHWSIPIYGKLHIEKTCDLDLLPIFSFLIPWNCVEVSLTKTPDLG